MKALSIRQPWAWAILHAGKRIENRSWSLPEAMRNKRVLIHASKGCTRDEYTDAVEYIRSVARMMSVPPLNELPRGAIVGAMSLIGCRPPCDWREAVDWHVPSQHGIELASIMAIAEPIPCKGALGFFNVPAEVEAEIRRRFG